MESRQSADNSSHCGTDGKTVAAALRSFLSESPALRGGGAVAFRRGQAERILSPGLERVTLCRLEGAKPNRASCYSFLGGIPWNLGSFSFNSWSSWAWRPRCRAPWYGRLSSSLYCFAKNVRCGKRSTSSCGWECQWGRVGGSGFPPRVFSPEI